MLLTLGIFAGILTGALLAWFFCTTKQVAPLKLDLASLRERLLGREASLQNLSAQNTNLAEIAKDKQETLNLLSSQNAILQTTLNKERETNQDKIKLLSDAQARLETVFKALSADSLQRNNKAFLDLAQQTFARLQEGATAQLELKHHSIDALVQPLKESLEHVDCRIGELEKERIEAYAGLTEQVKALTRGQGQLQTETANLVKALRMPHVRGRWGEIQLKRVVEMAGMLEYCDFITQAATQTEKGLLIPDLIVKLPGKKNIVVDSKCPLQAYLDALSATDEITRVACLKRHAEHVAQHISNLSAKSYWEQFQPAPEFVVLFLPGETFFSAALEQMPSLIEDGVNQKVILATPTTLIALLRAVAYGWRQEHIAKHAQEISDLGKLLHERICTVSEHLGGVGSHLNNAIKSYNSMVRSFESRVLVTARKFKELGTYSEKDVPELDLIDAVAVSAQAIELTEPLIDPQQELPGIKPQNP